MNSEENFIIEDAEKEESKNFFFDAYAFYEIIKENQNYKKYLNVGITTTKLNLFELYHVFLKENTEDLAETFLKKYYPFTVDFDENVIVEAARLKIKLNKRDVSMTDCVGYCFAKQLDIKFLTGDNAFEGMANVEFVK